MSAFADTLKLMEHSWLWTTMGFLILSCLVLLFALWRSRTVYNRAIEERQNHQEMIDNLFEGVYRSTIDGRQMSANPALARLNGYDTAEELLAGVKDIAKEWYVDPKRRDVFRRILYLHGKVENFVSEVYRHKTRERIWISESARLVRDKKSGRALYYEGSVREITETAKRLQLQEMIEKLTSQVPGGLFQLVRHSDGAFSLPFISAGFQQIMGSATASVEKAPGSFLNFIHPEDRAIYAESLKRSGDELDHWECEFRLCPPGDPAKWIRITATPEITKDAVTWYGYVWDISSRKENEVKIEKLAFYDSLTGLPNRRFLLNRMAELMKQRASDGTHAALLFIDLDNFKSLNDTMGHTIGDVFLTQVAERLQATVGPQDIVARMGGDEFVIVMPRAGAKEPEAARAAVVTANRVLAMLDKEFRLGETTHHTSASIGILVFSGAESGPDEVIKNADMAMYQVKASGRNGVALFDPEVLDREARRFRLLADLRSALAENRLQLHYQPQIDIDGHIVGVEALVRWYHPERGQVPPADFVTLAEQFGLAEHLGRCVVQRGVETLARWKQNPRTAGLRLAVNISLQSLRAHGFVEFVRECIESHGVEAHLLTLEMTERVMASNHAQLSRGMKALKAIGVRLSLDDFGTGYSSVAYLKKLPFDELKIDGSFVSDIARSETNQALVRTMLDMAATLKLSVVAEHVETRQQEKVLKKLGCAFYQGWLYSPALPETDLAEYIAEHGTLAPLPRLSSRATP